MSNSHYIIKNYQPADFNKYAQLIYVAEKLEPTGRCVSPQAVTEKLGRPNYSPEQDLLIVEIAGNFIGYMDVTPELIIKRVILDCWIHPEHRRRGLATKLLAYGTRRAQELRARVAHVNIPEDNIIAKMVLSRLGFNSVRHFLELRLDMVEVRLPDIDRVVAGCRYLRRGEEDKLAKIQNRAFTGTWGYNPNTVEEIIYFTNLSNCSTEDVILACDGDKVIGYCWTGTTYEEGDAGRRKARIFMLGADPDYRGRGAGKRALLGGLAHLKSKGLRVVELTVDSENKAACALYQSIGFEVWTGSLWYQKHIY